MYYYRRKTSPIKWIIIIIIAALTGFGYWFYINYFSKIEIPKKPETSSEITPQENPVNFLIVKLALVQGEVQIDVENKGYQNALTDSILHQGDKIKTGEASSAILKFDDNSVIRLGSKSEIILQNLAQGQILIEQLKGRTYHNFSQIGQYQIKYSNVLATALGTKFEFITNELQNFVAVLDFENKVRVEVLDEQEILWSVRLEANEKALLDLKAAKKDQLKIENIDVSVLTRESWYKWNFDLDKGLEEKLEEEPSFSIITESLELAAEAKETGIYLSWSIYNKDDFKNYKIVRSDKNAELKYPDDELIKSSTSKDLNSYLDTKIEKGKRYYYRVCVLKNNDKVICGNVVSLEISKEEEKDMTAPAAPLLSVSVMVDGANLIWTSNSEEDFKEYRVLRSLTNANLTLPQIGYLAIKKKGAENYLDKEVNITSAGNVYYRVCSIDLAGNFACSNVVWVENGQVK